MIRSNLQPIITYDRYFFFFLSFSHSQIYEIFAEDKSFDSSHWIAAKFETRCNRLPFLFDFAFSFFLCPRLLAFDETTNELSESIETFRFYTSKWMPFGVARWTKKKKKKDYRLLGRIPAASFLAFTYLNWMLECRFSSIFYYPLSFFFSPPASFYSATSLFNPLKRRKLKAQIHRSDN